MSAPDIVNNSVFRDGLIDLIASHVVSGSQREPDFDVEDLADDVLDLVVARLVAIAMETAGTDPVSQRVRREIAELRWGR